MRASGWSTRRDRAADPCPWCGPRDEIEFHYGGQAHVAYPADPEALSRRGVGRLPVHARQPAGACGPSAGCTPRMPALVRSQALHGRRTRSMRAYRAERSRRDDGAATVRRRRRDRPLDAASVHVRGSRAHAGLQGDTLASALLANGVDVVCASPMRGRPRGVYCAGVEEPCAFVEVRAPSIEPIVPATVVELVQGLVAAGARAWAACPPTAPAPCRRDHRHVHVETLVVGAARRDARRRRQAAAMPALMSLLDERPRDSTIAGWRRRRRGRRPTSGADARHRAGRLRRRLRGRRTSDRVPASACGTCARARWCWRPGRTSGPSRSPTTTGPGVMLASAAVAVRRPLRRPPRRARRGVHHQPLRARGAAALADAGMRSRPSSTPARAGRPRTQPARAGSTCGAAGRSPARTATHRCRAVHTAGPGGASETFDGRPAARRRRLEPGRPAVARHRRRAALRRGARLLRARRRRAGRGCGSWAPPPGTACPPSRPCGSRPPTTSAGISWTSNAIRPSPTCSRPSGTICARPST